jgi:glycosyltransferase involved in cell wall biosynthesis
MMGAVHVGLGCFTAGAGGARAHTIQLARGLSMRGLRVTLLCRASDADTHAALSATGLPVQVLHAHPDPAFSSPPDDGVDVRVSVSASVARAYAGATTQVHTIPVRTILNGVALTPPPAPLPAPPSIVWVGRLDRAAKDLALLVAVEARRRSAAPLVVVGDGPDAAWLDAAWVDARRVRRVGALDTPGAVRRALDEATVLLSTSPREGFGLAIAEALAAGRAVVARRAGGLTEALEPSGAARLFGPLPGEGQASTDALSAELAEALDALIDDADAARRFGHDARAFAERHLDEATMTDAYVALYRELAERGTRL